jgi:glycosyltransferase involved in cell wall biosynthesis
MPGDRRRFVAYARARNLPFELARPKERYDIVVLSELADISVWCDYPYGKVVYDLIDSYLAIPRTDWKQMLRGPVWFVTGRHKRFRFDYKETIEAMCRRADAVICTTQEQKHDIEAFCPNVHIVLDIHDTVVRAVKHDYSAVRPFNLVWEGLPSNIPQLESVSEVLRTVARNRPVILNIVSDPDRPRLLGRFGRIRSIEAARKIFENIRFHHWDETTCSNIIAGCDTAIIPINLDDPFTAGKPENKLLLLWRMGLPVVASAIQSYSRAFAAVGMPHLACKTSDDWIAALERLITDENERRRAGQEGRAFAEQNWNRTRLLSLWDNVFMSLGNDMANLVRLQQAASS